MQAGGREVTQHSGPILAERDGLKVRDCRACGYAHLDPIPGDQTAYYRDDFWRTKGAGWLAIYESQREWQAMRDGDILSLIESHTLGRSLLDIGAGYGFFLRAAVSRNWTQVVGVDPSREASAYAARALGAHVEPMGWEDVGFPLTTRYDALTAFWLLEHLPDPLRFLRWAADHLYGSGVLALALPHEFTALQAAASARARVHGYWVHETHTNYFTAASLGNLLGRARFRVVEWLATFPVETWIIAGHDYTAQPEVGVKLHREMQAQELAMTREQRLDEMRVRARLAEGRDLIVVAVKSD